MEEEGQVSAVKQEEAEGLGKKLLGNPHLETADRMRSDRFSVEVGNLVIVETCSRQGGMLLD